MILVTGGLGYIGSNTVVELINKGYEVIVADNLYNSSLNVLQSIKTITNKDIIFYQIDVSNSNDIEKVFQTHKIDAVIHFAGHKSVGESVNKPIMYYMNNINSTLVVSEMCLKYNVKKFIFSSSATVYGANTSPFVEDMELRPTTNPYGETKVMCERILSDIAKVNPDFSVILLRYFNPIGGHESGLLCEKPKGIPNNLMPYIVQVANGEREHLSIYGNDYNTVDGTGVRDYIHVTDLAIGHVLALENIQSGINIYNLGTGNGISVLQLVNKFKEVTGMNVPYIFAKRRNGDIDICYADCSKAEKELGFKAKYTCEDMCKDSISRITN